VSSWADYFQEVVVLIKPTKSAWLFASLGKSQNEFPFFSLLKQKVALAGAILPEQYIPS
jgi:hypothetical protein